MTDQRRFEQGRRSSELDDLSIFNEDDVGVFDSEDEQGAGEHWEEIGPEDHMDDAHHHHGAHAEISPDGHHWVHTGGSALGMAVGAVMTMAGVCLMLTVSLAPNFAETLTGPLAKVGLTAMSLLLAGLMVFGFAFLALRQNKLVNTIRAGQEERGRLETGLEYLVQAQEHHLDRPPASGEELDRVLDCLQRQDEKLNNLTKAIKMYGKPLIEISNQSSESVHHLEELNRQVAGLAESLQGQGQTSVGDLKELLESKRGLTGEDLHRELEDHLEKLEARIDESAKRVAGGVERLLERGGDRSGEPALDEIQRGLANLANTLSAVQKSVAGGTHSAPAPRSEPTHAPQSSPPSSGGSGIGGLAHSIAGPKKGAGKNVLGAIAKLKQMRN